MDKQKCRSKYKNGNPCRAYAVVGELCKSHSEEEIDEMMSGEYERKQKLAQDQAQRTFDMMKRRRALDCEYRGFRIVYRGHGDPHQGGEWQVTVADYAAGLIYAEVMNAYAVSVGYDCGIYDTTLDALKAQIDDILEGVAPAVTETPDGGAVVVSGVTGEIYAEICPEDWRAEKEHSDRAREKHEEAVANRKRREESLRQLQADRAAERARKDAEAKLALEERAAALQQDIDRREREYRTESRKRLRALHERQDIEGLQRTNLDGDLLCDSCCRVYHNPDFPYCYGCSRGARRYEHQRRLDSGAIARRMAERDRIRQAYLAPYAEEKRIEAVASSARRKAANAEINAMLSERGFTDWDVTTLHNFCAGSGLFPRAEAIEQARDVISACETLSEPARQHVSDWIDNLRSNADKSERVLAANSDSCLI